ncbi:MAG: hypothetical protein ABJJ37_26455 [Roseibium sp.]
MANASRAAHVLRAHIIVVAIATFLLWYGQTVDEYRALIYNAFSSEGNLWSLTTLTTSSLTLFVIFPFVIWFSARWLTNRDMNGNLRTKYDDQQPFRKSNDTTNWFLRWSPRILAIVPLLTIGLAAWKNSRTDDNNTLIWFTALSVVAAIAWIIFFASRTRHSYFQNITRYLKLEFAVFGIFLVSFLTVNLFLVLISDVKFPQFFGVLTYGVGFFVIVLIVSTFLVWAHMRTKVPYMILIGLWAGFWALTDRTNNHEVNLLTATKNKIGNPLQDPPDFDTAFSYWLGHKIAEDQVRNLKPNGKTPVFVVAVAGGGIFAAQNAAFVLAKLDDSLSQYGCGEFSRNVFAISGISGGSVGAALHGALLKDQAENQTASDCHNQKTHLFPKLFNVLNEDLLAPVVANFATLDYPQRLIPWPIFPDRAGALENAIKTAVKDHHQPAERYLLEAASNLWDAKSDRPALVLNTAELGSGRTVASSPFTFRGRLGENSKLSERYPRENATFREILAKLAKSRHSKEEVKVYFPAENCSDKLEPYEIEFDTFNENRDLSLIQAAVMSARFPYASPAGTITKLVADTCGGGEASEKLFAVESQYIDGGYVEASGTERALKLVKLMQKHVKNACDAGDGNVPECSVEIHMVSITLRHDDLISDKSYGLVSTPPIGLLNTWSRRSKTSVEAANAYFDRENANIGKFHQIAPYDHQKVIPLGWRLSRPTSRTLEKLICESSSNNEERYKDIAAPMDSMNDLRNLVNSEGHSEWNCLDPKNS